MRSLLHLSDFQVRTPSGYLTPALTMEVNATEAVGVAGPSGVGKSLCVMALLGQFDEEAGWKISGTAHFRGEDLFRLSRTQKLTLFGTQIGYVPQQTALSLDPLHPVGVQVRRLYRERLPDTAIAAEKRFRSILARLDVSNTEQVCSRWPGELSGGEIQRVILATTLAMKPALVIADEPTAHLDPATEREFLNLMLTLKRDMGFGLVVVSHRELLLAGLVNRIVRLTGHDNSSTLGSFIVPTTEGAHQSRPATRGTAQLTQRLRAQRVGVSVGKTVLLTNVSLQISAGEVIGIVGRSGAGKSVLARTLAGIVSPSHGRIELVDKVNGHSKPLEGPSPDVQLIFQDPVRSFDPLRTVQSTLFDAARRLSTVSSVQNNAILAQLVALGLDPALRNKIPSALSGGEIQRLSIARALLAQPSVIIADEPTSALDSQSASKVLMALQRYVLDEAASMIVISHDLNVVSTLCDTVIVMAEGAIREVAPAAHFFSRTESAEGTSSLGLPRSHGQEFLI